MKFDELESIWTGQAPALAAPRDLAVLKRALLPELRRRGRMLGYGLFCATFGLVVGPLLAVANYRYAPPAHPGWAAMNLLIWMTVLVAWLVYMLRQMRRQRSILRQSADTVRALTAASVTSLVAEAQDYRRILWQLPPLVALQLVTLYVNFPVTTFGWTPFVARAAFALGLPLLMSLVCWRHYRVNLMPQLDLRKEILRQLG